MRLLPKLLLFLLIYFFVPAVPIQAQTPPACDFPVFHWTNASSASQCTPNYQPIFCDLYGKSVCACTDYGHDTYNCPIDPNDPPAPPPAPNPNPNPNPQPPPTGGGQGACIAPRPEDPALAQAIKEAQKRGGAAALVNPEVLRAIYLMEAAVEYSHPDKWKCERYPHAPSFVGLMSVSDTEYERVVPAEEQMNDIGVCEGKDCKLSRCNIVDALEIASRVLLDKIYIWDPDKDVPLGKLDDASDAYYASCRYYGSFFPDSITKNLVAYLPPEKIPADGQTSYCEFVTLYSGLYSNASQLPPRGDKPYSGMTSDVKFTYDACQGTQITGSNAYHPLRPDPDKPQSVEDDFLTTFCAMRPAPMQINEIDLRKPTVDLKTVGRLTQDFSEFITPLLSITDQSKSDYNLPYIDKAQRYLADFLEGRAYYEPEPETETSELDLQQQGDLFNRLGVFRKLAPAAYQNQLKKALIERAVGIFSDADNPYGFTPASQTVHNYIVGYWNAGQQKVVAKGQGQAVTLADFYKSKMWAPLDDDWQINWGSAASLAEATEQWAAADNGKWYKLWPYVPMFSREDTEGTIKIVDSNPPPDPWSPPGSTPIEENHSSTTEIQISHPHLARAYEVSTTLSYLLAPQGQHEAERPQLKDEWLPKAWELSNYWLDPSYPKPHPPVVPQSDVILGPLCDVDPVYTTPIYSSGDVAYNDVFSTDVNRQDQNVPLEELNLTPAKPVTTTYCADGSAVNYDCEKCRNGTKDESACIIRKEVRSSPDYLISYTPFLNQILTSTTLSGRGIFDIFTAYDPEKELSLDQEYGWPGLGSEGEESPEYDFSGGRAEAGMFKAGDSQSYYYRFLGTVQCAKERAMQVLQPFISGEPYKPYASTCFPELETPPPGSNTIGQATLSCADTDNVFVYQSDPRWKDTKAPPPHDNLDSCTIGSCGCGSSSTTIILNSFGVNTDVVSVWNKQHEIGGYLYQPSSEFQCLTIHSGPMQIMNDAGLGTAYIGDGSGSGDWDEVEKYLKDCGLIYTIGDAYWPNSGNITPHVVVTTGIIKDSSGKVTAIKTMDPGTASGNGLVRILGVQSGNDYGYSVRGLWAITPP